MLHARIRSALRSKGTATGALIGSAVVTLYGTTGVLEAALPQIRQAAETNNVDRISIETTRRQVLLLLQPRTEDGLHERGQF